MNGLEYAKQQLDRFYTDTSQSQKITPSYPFIESYSTVLLEVILFLEEKNTEMDTKLLSLRMRADIFKEDLVGELYDDYKKGNKRFRENWLSQKKKIDDITIALFQYLNEISDNSTNF